MRDYRTGTFVSLLLASLTGASAAFQSVSGGVYISCAQGESQLQCDFRSSSTSPVTYSAGTLDGQTLSQPELTVYPWSGASTAILIIVDTSDPGRQPVIEANISQIRTLTGWLKPHHKAGLGHFDKELRLLAPIGSSREQLNAAAGGLRAEGMTTELYRSQLQAIDMLRNTTADRRALLVFSDGQAEDQAYFHNDVVAAARNAGVVIYTFGFPRSTPLSVALQTVRRLAEETGGLFAESNGSFVLPDTALSAPLHAIDTGGRLRFDLPALLKSAPAATSITLNFTVGTGAATIEIPIDNPAAAAAVALPNAVTDVQDSASAPAAAPVRETPPEQPNTIFWFGLPAFLLLLVVLALVAMYSLLRRAQTIVKAGVQPAAAPGWRPLAYLVSQETHPKCFPITREIWRIGRSRDNELTLDDSSVSRRHAEIQRRADGKFHIQDRHSTNGIFINSRRVGSGELHEGDIVEIGDVALRFTESMDYQLGENTAVLNTRAPVH